MGAIWFPAIHFKKIHGLIAPLPIADRGEIAERDFCIGWRVGKR